jgi:hypothetical protein
MKLNSLVSASALVAATLAAPVALAATKKTTTTNATTGNRAGTLVAMSGSGSLSSSSESRSSYLGMRFLPYTMSNSKVKEGNTTTETPSTRLVTMPKQLDFYGNFGSWAVRPTLDLDLEGISYLGVGYNFAPNLELGGFVTLVRTTSEGQNKTKNNRIDFLVGPQAVYFTEVAGMETEIEGRLFLLSGLEEQTVDNTTTANRDESGFGFEVAGNVVRELSKGLEYVGGLRLGYGSRTDKKDKNNEKTTSGLDFTIVPAGVRFKF